MDRLLRRLTRLGVRRVRAGDHWAWAVLAAAAFVLRRARRDEPDRVFTLRRGETLVIGPAEPASPPS